MAYHFKGQSMLIYYSNNVNIKIYELVTAKSVARTRNSARIPELAQERGRYTKVKAYKPLPLAININI